jgi:hypothetical protein
MPVEMGMWRIDGDRPQRLAKSTLVSEAALEDFLEQDPSLLGFPLLVIGRQVRTPYGKYIDLLAIDGDGNLHVLELKRDRTPREVVAQVLDYGSWVTKLTRAKIIEYANSHLVGRSFEAAFEETFGDSPPDELNADLQLTIIATELDTSSERIVNYLRDFGVPINVVFFVYLEDEGRRYLARSWLATSEDGAAVPGTARKKGKRAEWNGLDWFVSFGDELARSWDDGQKYGFVSVCGDPWSSRTLRALPVGGRVNVHIPKHGYVAVGITLREAKRFDQAEVRINGEWLPLAQQQLGGPYRHTAEDDLVTDDNAEYVVPVRWLAANPKSLAYWEKGMFANQNSACKLRQEFTLDRLGHHFGLTNDDATQD